jgi:hypothetical protein
MVKEGFSQIWRQQKKTWIIPTISPLWNNPNMLVGPFSLLGTGCLWQVVIMKQRRKRSPFLTFSWIYCHTAKQGWVRSCAPIFTYILVHIASVPFCYSDIFLYILQPDFGADIFVLRQDWIYAKFCLFDNVRLFHEVFIMIRLTTIRSFYIRGLRKWAQTLYFVVECFRQPSLLL